ncbi:hypothetical protein CTAYLR_003064 [Chrysophaeum taylorii]|uniref:6-phosphogluconolactonase n=1 Tax=Chrysophaeum taylorii TaxID=2483200 RepID=A0AAD7XEU9_9STRA|nr:hypothetical protein CTAYLR_003064 [Chrysophaeum taylorii]
MVAKVRVARDGGELGATVAEYVAALSAASGERFVVAVSGGSMPGVLAALAHRRDIEFGKWEVFFADERCVPLDSPDSNYKACNDALFSKLPGIRVHAIDPSLEPAKAAETYEKELMECGGVHLALLGAGPDGHTASLFPGHALFETPGSKLVDVILDSPKPPPARVTLTRAALAAAPNLAFIATGTSKADLFKTIFVRQADGEISYADPLPRYPITTLLSRSGVADWFTDAAAVAKVPSQT